MRSQSRRATRPSFARQCPSIKEGAGNAGCAARTRSLACESKKHTSVVTTGTPQSADIPCALVLTAYPVLLCLQKFLVFGNRIFLASGPDTQISLNCLRKSTFARTRFCPARQAARTKVQTDLPRPWGQIRCTFASAFCPWARSRWFEIF